MWMVGVAVPTGDPVCRCDDVDAGLEHLDVEVLVGKYPMKGQHIGLGGEDLVDRARGDNAVRLDACELARVLTDLLWGIAVPPHQFEFGLCAIAFDHLGAHVARGDQKHESACWTTGSTLLVR